MRSDEKYEWWEIGAALIIMVIVLLIVWAFSWSMT